MTDLKKHQLKDGQKCPSCYDTKGGRISLADVWSSGRKREALLCTECPTGDNL